MTEASDELTGRVLRAFADLAPTGRPSRERDHIDAPLVWLGADGTDKFVRYAGLISPVGGFYTADLPSSAATRRLAALDRLNHQARAVHLGCEWLTGLIKTEFGAVRIVTPLLSLPVHLHRTIAGFNLEAAGDYHLTSLITDRAEAMRLEASRPTGLSAFASQRLFSPVAHWINDVLAAMQLPPATIVPADVNPLERTTGDLAVVPGGGLYFAGPESSLSRRSVLSAWSDAKGICSSAFAALYGIGPELPDAPDGRDPVVSPLTLTEAQSAVVRRVRAQRIVAVSGAPGNGKTHTACAVAIDAVSRGAKVLVATKSSYASDVLADMLRRQPGPVPVVFGDSEQREQIARELSEGLRRPPRHDTTDAREAAADAQLRRVNLLRAAAARSLQIEVDVERSSHESALASILAVEVAGAFAPSADLVHPTALLAELRSLGDGWLARRRARRIESRLRQMAQAAPDLPIETIEEALGAAHRRREAMELSAAGGLDLEAVWSELQAGEHELRRLVGEAVEGRAVASRSDADARRAVAALARALRAGRASRRELLALLDGSALLDALPLWVGTLGDIDDLLPAVPGLFDLVILDESSEIDQLTAAPALLRGRAAVVVGDPQQLRAPSFVSDEMMREVLRTNGIDELADRIDVRRDSAFDCAAGAADVTWLDEHHRSVPHLIEFSARHFYTRPIHLVTRHPRNECFDAIDIVAVDEGRDADESRQREIATVLRVIAGLADAGAKSVGVITPFRSCCDALTEAVLSDMKLDVVERTDLRVGTVHGFQGDERDVMIIALGLSSHDLPRRRGFVEESGLFNVMVTRAKQRQIVVTSLTPAVGGLLGEYLAYAETAPTAPTGAPAPDGWSADLAVELQRAGHAVRTEYPVGRWTIDLVVGSGADAVGLITRAHPDGPAAHIHRQLELRAASWNLIDAFPTRWDGEATSAAIVLHARLTAASAAGGDLSPTR